MFNRSIDLAMIDSASKMSLKMSCLKACDNNVSRARELYEFLSEGINDIPDVEPIRPSAYEQVKRGASEVLEWISSHKEDVTQGVALIKSMRGSVNSSPTTPNLPPIPKI